MQNLLAWARGNDVAYLELPGGLKAQFHKKESADERISRLAAATAPKSRDDINRKYDLMMFGQSLEQPVKA